MCMECACDIQAKIGKLCDVFGFIRGNLLAVSLCVCTPFTCAAFNMDPLNRQKWFESLLYRQSHIRHQVIPEMQWIFGAHVLQCNERHNAPHGMKHLPQQ